MSKFLYGAAVQGIQDFIFKTNELKHIVGASELVEQICTTAFNEFAKNGESVVRAAGNIKFIFEKEEDCAKVVREFPKKVMTMAPGITISQAVTLLDDNFGDAVDKLEARLKNQRNKVPQSVTLGLMGIKRTNNTGLPVTSYEEKKEGKEQKTYYYDDATSAKLGITDKGDANPEERVWDLCEKSFGIEVRKKNVAYNISEITDQNDWIAIIHADGNGLGRIIQKVGKKMGIYKEFSKKLDEATTVAAQKTFKRITEKYKIDENGFIPIRPIVLDGDDMTVIIRGNLAVDYATFFMDEFEKATKDKIGYILKGNKELGSDVFESGEDYLTACAGIAFIKSSFPFYYGYQLAEDLCGKAKKDTKALVGENALPKSCLMFHKVQDSFITTYSDIVQRELTADDDLSFKAGPYYIKQTTNKYQVEDLKRLSDQLDNENGDGIKSGIRQWITARIDDANFAKQRKNRMLQVFKSDKSIVDDLTQEKNGVCIAYDVLAYHTIMNQKTNDK